MGSKRKKDYPLEKIAHIFSSKSKGSVLDLGAGAGNTSKIAAELGFSVTAFDVDEKGFGFASFKNITFVKGNLNNPLPFDPHTFDYVVFMEVIEHIYNPDFVISQIAKVLKPGGTLILTTPNILNIKSRLRFLFEGSYNLFREPILDLSNTFSVPTHNLHVIPWRYHELEYLLAKNDLEISAIATDRMETTTKLLALLIKPLLLLQCWLKEKRSSKSGALSYKRINKIVFSKEIVCGKHLIVEAKRR